MDAGDTFVPYSSNKGIFNGYDNFFYAQIGRACTRFYGPYHGRTPYFFGI